MIRWVDEDPRRLLPQEQALLALCDRITTLEQAFTAEVEAHQLTRKRLDYVQHQLKEAERKADRLGRDHKVLFDILGRE
jgi:hypothetical protein